MKGYELYEELKMMGVSDETILCELINYLSDDDLYEALSILKDNI